MMEKNILFKDNVTILSMKLQCDQNKSDLFWDQHCNLTRRDMLGLRGSRSDRWNLLRFIELFDHH